jgi:hypothetical protein
MSVIDGTAPLDTRRNYLKQRRRGGATRVVVAIGLGVLLAWLIAAAMLGLYT